jgi:hypothetical protein
MIGERLATVEFRPEAWINVETGEPATGGVVMEDPGSNPVTHGLYQLLPDVNPPPPANYY